MPLPLRLVSVVSSHQGVTSQPSPLVLAMADEQVDRASRYYIQSPTGSQDKHGEVQEAAELGQEQEMVDFDRIEKVYK